MKEWIKVSERKFRLAKVRELLEQLYKEEITMMRFVEILNEISDEKQSQNVCIENGLRVNYPFSDTETSTGKLPRDLQDTDFLRVHSELVDEATKELFGTEKYWRLRAKYLERHIDPTYTKIERSNCWILYTILVKKQN